MNLRKLLAYGSGVGIEIQAQDLEVVLAHVRPAGVEVAAATTIRDFRQRPAAEWGAEYGRFLRDNNGSHLAACIVLPKREVIVRQIMLPGVAKKDLESAVGFQIETLHPYGEEEVACGWERVSASGAVLIGILRRTLLVHYTELFSEAGIAVSAFTFGAAALHGAARLLLPPPADFLAAGPAEDGEEIDIYGESAARPVFSAQFDLPRERAAALAIAEMRLPPETPLRRLDEILPAPIRMDAALDLNSRALPYAAALAGACPRLAPAANLLPAENRSTNSRAIFVPTAVLAALLLLVAGAVFGYSAIEERRYRKALAAEISRLEPVTRKAAAADRELALTQNRMRLLDEFRGRSKYDLDTLNELTRLLAPPVWTNTIELTRDAVVMAGEAEQAAPLLKLIDSSPFFKDSTPAIPFVKSGASELFRIRSLRRTP